MEWRHHPLTTAVHAALAHHRDVVLQAPTGSGKSTLVPLALLDEGAFALGRILMLEPRRIAARAVAARMAWLLGEAVGQTVGYRTRLDTRVSRATRIEVVTEGVLTRLLQADPALEGIACLIFDEFHERSLQADLGLALSLDARRQLAASFRIIIMSATLSTERLSKLLGEPAQIEVPGSAFAVQVEYLGRGAPLVPASGAEGARDAQRLTQALARTVQRALEQTGGDVLVFLPGVGEIRRLEQALSEIALPAAVRVWSLYGDMSGDAQDAVLTAAAPGTRKVVLATNIAETSLTIPGITAVVDSGLVRRARFDPVTGMSRLSLERISRAASEQRRGRAGRVADGVCYRLWSEGAQSSLAAQTPPEILEADLAGLALELERWGAREPQALEWLDAPPAAMLQQARELLSRLGALDAGGRLTALGREMTALPVHPRLAAVLLAGRDHQAIPLAARIAALLSERDLLRPGAADPDLRSRLELLETRGHSAARPAHSINALPTDRGAIERVRRSAETLEAAVQRLAPLPQGAAPQVAAPEGYGDAEWLAALLAVGYPDRIGQRRDGPAGRYLLSNGRGAAFAAPSSLARAPYIVALALDDREREARIDLAVELPLPVLERQLAAHIRSEQSCGWSPREGAVLWRRVRRFGNLVLEERVQPPPDGSDTTAAMLEGVRALGIDCLPWDAEARTLQARMQFVRSLARPELTGWPESDDATLCSSLEQWLLPWLGGITRREHLSRLPLAEALRARLTSVQRRALEALAPVALGMPTGSQIRVDYLDDNAPCVAVRLQEVFGVTETPRIGGGAVPVTFKLLSPAQRPVQITRDLAGFWRSSYAAVRKDMRGRYPKHAWPENPLEARPSRGTGRRPRGVSRGRS